MASIKVSDIEIEGTFKHAGKDIVTDGSNVGSGKSICKDKSGHDVRFRTVTEADESVILVENTNDVSFKTNFDCLGFDQDGEMLCDEDFNPLIV